MSNFENLTNSKMTRNKPMSVYIYGAGNKGREFLAMINDCYDGEISVKGFIDRTVTGSIENYPVFRLSELKDTSVRIVIAVIAAFTVKEIHQTLRLAGFHDVWWFYSRQYRKEYKNLFLEQCVNCQEWKEDTLVFAEMNAMDCCNLNCVGCNHFSPIFKKNIPNTQSRLNDVKKLREKISHIARFNILGGEPFLNPELCSYLEIKNIFPHTRLEIITNGLLLLKTPRETLEKLHDENICIVISKYEPTIKCMDQIQRLLDRYDLIYSFYENRKMFNIPLSFTKGDKYCLANGCVSIWNGKIARCPILMYIAEFNKYFNTSFPEEGTLSLEESVSGKELVNLLEKDVPLCSYCGHHEVGWDVCGNDITIDKFVHII